MDINNEILQLTSQLYDNLNLTRSDIQFIIEHFRTFVTNCYNPLLLGKVQESLSKSISDEAKDEINKTFKKYEDPFENYESECNRHTIYKNVDSFVEPVTNIVKQKSIDSYYPLPFIIEKRPFIHLSMKYSLTKLLEIDGLFDSMMSYMEFLKNNDRVLMNFVQSSLWKEQSRKFQKEDGIVLPLIAHFDVIETGSLLHSQSGNNDVGAIYATIPCFPPNFAMQLGSIILCSLFYGNQQQICGNYKFEHFINDLHALRNDGIVITVGNKRHKIYFIPSLIMGDNLALNDIFGFVKSFTLSAFCRFCYANSHTIKTLCTEDESLLRSVEKYKEDIKILDSAATGIKEECIFNQLDDFHVIKNQTADIMHDLFEGVCNCVMSNILLTLTCDDKCFSIEYINYQLGTVDFGFESSNLPPQISKEYLKANKKLNMSAPQILFFTRYFGILVGNCVPQDNRVWKLYKKLRSIINITTSPTLMQSHVLELQMLIPEHHQLYKKLYGDLKPTFHYLTHYARLMERIGPLIKLSTLPFESKHRELEKSAQAGPLDILTDISVKYRMNQGNFYTTKYKNMYVTSCEGILDKTTSIHFPPNAIKYNISSITINDVTYNSGVIINADILDGMPEFGRISKIYGIGNKFYFIYTPLQVLGFNKHYFAYSVVEDTSIEKKIEYGMLVSKTPCLLFELDNTDFIVTRHII